MYASEAFFSFPTVYMQFLMLKFSRVFSFLPGPYFSCYLSKMYVSEVPTVKILGRPESGVLVVEEGRELSLICQVAHNFVKSKSDKKLPEVLIFVFFHILKLLG